MSRDMKIPVTKDEWIPPFLKWLQGMATGHEPPKDGFKGEATESLALIKSLEGLAKDTKTLCEMKPERSGSYIAERYKIIEEKCGKLFLKVMNRLEQERMKVGK